MGDIDAKPVTEDLLSFSDLLNLCMSFHNRVDTLWQRVLYTHAGIVGVMIFFATSPGPFVVPRTLVFFFYSLTLGITVFGFLESYAGLRATLDDLKTLPRSTGSAQTQNWILGRNYQQHARRRIFALGLVWLVVGYLILYPIANGLEIFRGLTALLHKSVDRRGSPIPGRTHPTTSVTGMPSAVKPFMTATRTWNSAT